MTDLLLGIDVGTTACKAAVVDRAGVERAHGQAPTPWQRVPTGAEIDPEALCAAALAAAGAALADAPEGDVRGVGVTSMAETGVLLDDGGVPVAPAIAWHDARGADEARAFAAALGERRFVRTTGLPAGPLCSLAKLGWVRDHVPDARRGTRWLNVGEWVVRRLGGRDVAELSLASRTGLLDLRARAPFHDALAWAGLPDDLMGELVVAGTACGVVDEAVLPAAAGAALTVAGHDHLAAGIGVGVVAAGDVLDSCGTAEALIAIVAPPLEPDAIEASVAGGVTVGWHVAPDRHALLGSLWSGLALQEVLDALGAGSDRRSELDAGALATAPGEAPAFELELHSLERRPLTLPSGHAPEHIWRAAIDSANREVAALLAHIDAVAGPHRRLVVAGGWARDPAVLAARRSLGAVQAPAAVQAGARGAALLSGVAAGIFTSADALPDASVRHQEVV